MQIVKRNGKKEEVKFDKILQRVKTLSDGLKVEPVAVSQKVVAGLVDGISSTKIDELLAETAAALTTEHPDYARLAARISVSALHKVTSGSFYQTMKALYKEGVLSDEFIEILRGNGQKIDAMIDYGKDLNFDYFGFKTLEKGYLQKINGKIVERPQHLFMRVAVGVAGMGGGSLADIKELYDMMSNGLYTHATPTLFNAGTKRPQLSSCFVEGTEVLTVNDGVKFIENVKLGDLVVTHKGTVEKVVQLHKNDLNDRQIFDVKVFKTPVIKVTGNHRFYSITKEQLRWGEQPQMNSIDSLRVGDYIAIPNMRSGKKDYALDLSEYLAFLPKSDGGKVNYSFEVTDDKITMNSTWSRAHKLNVSDCDNITLCKKSSTINRFVNVDKDFAKFIGVWYGDGCITSSKNSSGKRYLRSVGVAVHHENKELIKFCEDYLNKAFGLPVTSSHYPHSKNPNVVNVTAHSGTLAHLFNHLFGRGFGGKKLFKDVFSWDKELVTSFLEGLVSSDGCVFKDGSGYGVTLSNKKLLKEIYMVSRQVGLDASYQEKGIKNAFMSIPNRAKINPLKVYGDDRIQKASDKNNFSSSVIQIGGETFVRVMSKEKNDSKPKYVYTLGIEETHSYSVEGLLAENCFLVAMKEDSIEGIYDTLKECALISKNAGGIGLHIHNVRASGSAIKGINGQSDGIIPMLKNFNETARYVNQGGRRKGSFAIYLEPWHADIEGYLDLKKNTGKDELRARDLYLALWVPDLFMKRVKDDGDWTLMCPNECPGLPDVWGAEFEKLYTKYEKEGKGRKTIKARELMGKIIEAQIETGVPYILFKDAANAKSNQQNLGTIKSSNLCTEIIEYSAPDETAVCNLASLCLPKFVKGGKFDHKALGEVVRVATRNLNRVIDINFYPTPATKKSNMRHRPIGLGVQGLADVFFMLGLPFDSEEALKLNKEIAETIYFHAASESMELAKKSGAYETFKGSPASEGKLQYRLWGITPTMKYDWEGLEKSVKEHGIRNSLLVAPMPTASTASIFGNVECFEAITSNLYKRMVLAGEFVLVNKYLVSALEKLGKWNKDMRDRIIAEGGSISGITEIPEELRNVYKTVWEIKNRTIIDMAADRGPFICQSQSMNLWFAKPTFGAINSALFYSWERGLKTGSYYIRTKPAVEAVKVTTKGPEQKQPEFTTQEALACSLDNPEDCVACSS